LEDLLSTAIQTKIKDPPFIEKTIEKMDWQREKTTGSNLHRVHIFSGDETGIVYMPTQLGRTLQLYW
jgi:hypothetical protein